MVEQFLSQGVVARRRFLQTSAGAAVLAFNAPAVLAAKDASLAQVQVSQIELVIKQRMLVQRCVKFYAQSLLNARGSDAKRLTIDSIARVDAAHAKQVAEESKKEGGNFQSMNTLEKISKEWPKLRAILQKPPAEKALPDVIQQSEWLVKQINQSTGASDMYLSRSPIGVLFATSGKQTFISQRIATYYFLRALNHNPDEAARIITDLMRDYEVNARLLEKGTDNTTEIKFLHQLGGTQWPYFKEAINVKMREDPTQLDYNVATAAENMLEVLERISLLYYKLATE